MVSVERHGSRQLVKILGTRVNNVSRDDLSPDLLIPVNVHRDLQGLGCSTAGG